jgi:Tol biopolymer transport system component
VISIVAPLAALAFAAQAPATPPRIAFEHDETVWTMAADGSDRQKVAAGTAPAFSPDGSAIAFVRGGTYRDSQIWVAAPDGTGARQALPEAEASVASLRWSPDGSRLLFSRIAFGGDALVSSLEVMRADGAERRAVLTLKATKALESVTEPTWVPGGERVLYTRTRPGRDGRYSFELRSVRLDGTDDRLFLAGARGAAFSPDGTRLAFGDVSDAKGEFCGEDECYPNADLAVAAADGSGRVRLLRTSTDEGDPAWAPDGTRLAFTSGRNTRELPFPESEIHSIATDGSCLTWLTNGNPDSRTPSWSPGAGATAPAACGAAGREPLIERKLPSSLRRALWLGPRFGQALLGTAVGTARSGIVEYIDCASFEPKDCPPAFLLVESGTCQKGRELGFVTGRLSAARRVGRAIVARKPGDSRGVIYAGRSWMHVQIESSSTRAEREPLFTAIARGLQTAAGGAPGTVRLPAKLRRRMPANVRGLIKPC